MEKVKQITLALCFIGGAIMAIVISLLPLQTMNNSNGVVYVVVKSADPTFEFWQTVKRGSEIAAVELNVDMIFTGALEETDVEGQIAILEEIIEKQPMAIVLAPTDYEKLVPIAERVIGEGITLVTIDSAINTPLVKSLISTNNIEAAKKAGEEMIDLLEGRGKVGIIAHVKGTSTAIEREKGFREAFSEEKNIELIEKTWFSNGDEEQAYNKTLDMLERHPDITGIFGANEKTVMGIARALEEVGLAGQIKLVGFDGNREEVKYIERGTLHSVMVQRPFNIGYLGVKEAVEISLRRKEPEYIDTGSVLIRKENLYTPENQKLLFPFVE